MKTRPYPDYLLRNCSVRTARQWRAWHRQRIKAALKAADLARHGCAWGPASVLIGQAIATLEEAVKLSQRKNWQSGGIKKCPSYGDY